MPTPESELVLRKMRALNRSMNQATPNVIEIREFRDLFMELDDLLKTGAMLPPSWITPEGRRHLPTETTHTITDFDPPAEEQLRKRGLAWCGHPFVSATEYCNNRDCGNYLHLHR